MNMNRISLAAIALVALPLTARSNQSVSFRVVAKIYADADEKPLTETLTLFDSGVAYDLPQSKSRFATVFDTGNQRVTLLDRETQVQSTVGVNELVKYAAGARAAAQDPEQKKQIGLSAKVESDAETDSYTIRFGPVVMQTTAQTLTQAAAASDYGRYIDLSARLNIARQMGPPPFARMSLNDAMTSDNKVPLVLTRTITNKGVVQRHRQKNEVAESLSEEDRVKINEIRGMLSLYREVDLNEFPR